MMLLI